MPLFDTFAVTVEARDNPYINIISFLLYYKFIAIININYLKLGINS